MLPVSLNLQDKKVLIVGGGKMGKRKAQQLVAQGADVFVIALQFDKSWTNWSWSKIKKAYEKSDLQDVFLVYAATSDIIVNHQILVDAQQLGILCSSVTYDETASFHAMAFNQEASWQIAVSTGSPLASKELLGQLAPLARQHQQRWQLEKKLRRLVVQRSSSPSNPEVLSWLNQLTTLQMQHLEKAEESSTVTLLVFHGVSNPQAMVPLRQFLQLVDTPNHSALLCFVSEQAVANVDQSSVCVFSMKELFHFVEVMGWITQVQPMVLFQGEISRRIQQACPPQFQLSQPWVQRDQWLAKTVAILKETYPGKKLVFITHQPMINPPQEGRWITINDLKQPKLTSDEQVIAFLLLPGRHVLLDVSMNQNEQVTSLLENPKIRQALANQIQHEQKG